MSIRARWGWAATALAIGLVALSARADEKKAVDPAEARLKADVSFLADDAREGRAPGTKGIEAAADYIAAEFQRLGLKTAPGAEGYFQKFELTGDLTFAKPPTFAVSTRSGAKLVAKPDVDFGPLTIGRGVELKDLKIVFAGYGITSKPDEDNTKFPSYDDYADIDVKDKAVLILRHSPRFDVDEELFGGSKPNSLATFFQKVSNAAKHGAKAVIIVNDLAGLKGEKDTILPLGSVGGFGAGTPLIMVTREYANKLLAAAEAPALEDLENIAKDLKPRSRPLDGLELSLEIVVERAKIKTKNVIGVLEGSGPFADETIVVGAHYDHLGRGGFGSLSPNSHDIHNGADDNASGTAMVIETARRLASRKDPLPRRVVFMTFSAEERGLIGSAYYVNHPLFPIEKTVAMINFDMVGRLNEKNELMVYGTGTSKGLGAIVESLGKAEGFAVRSFADGRDRDPDARYFAASDHFSFYQKHVPVLFLFTGVHPDYHRPTDDSNLINYPGMARIADLGELLLLDLIRRPVRPIFADRDDDAAATPNPHAEPAGPKVAAARDAHAEAGEQPRMAYFGAVPDYGAQGDDKGVHLSDVAKDSPAFKAGLKKTDVLIRLGGIPIGDLQDYADALRAHKPGDKVEVVVRRGDQPVTLSATLGARGGPGS